MRPWQVWFAACMGMVAGAAIVEATSLPTTIIPQPNQVGVVAAVTGRVELARSGAVGHVVQSSQPVFIGDLITTDAAGRLQIMLLDETIFTIGPNSAMTIDEFVYDPSTDAGKVSAEIMRGAFRFVTGRIAHKHPEQMKVKLPSGTIGVRGTIVVGRVEGERSSVALVGSGGVIVSNAVNNVSHEVSITRPGFGTTIPGVGMPPTPPTFVPPAELSALAATLGPPPMQPSSERPGDQPARADQPGQPRGEPHGPPNGPMPPGTQPTQPDQASPFMGPHEGPMTAPNSGPYGMPMQPQFMSPMMSGLLPPMLPPPPPGTELNTTQTFTQSAQDSAKQTNQALSLISTLDQLRQIQTGVFHFAATNPTGFHQTAPVDRFGPMHVQLDVDFGARTIGGGNSRMRVQNGLTAPATKIDETLPIPAQSFNSGSGDAIFTATSSTLSAKLTVKNDGGTIGAKLLAEATYTNGGMTGSGAIDNIPRQSVASAP